MLASFANSDLSRKQVYRTQVVHHNERYEHFGEHIIGCLALNVKTSQLMISNMADATDARTLGEYIREKLEGRSIRALATYANISVGTASNLVNDRIDNPAPDTLMKVAEYLNIPVENLFRRAGYLPETETAKPDIILEIDRLLGDLPDPQQREIFEIVKAIHRLHTKQEKD
jgi:transcriptional regulator with XRE-family HTH domain